MGNVDSEGRLFVSSKLVVSISAYNAPASLAQLVENVSHYVDPETIIVFDASPEHNLAKGLDVEVLTSPPGVRWGHLVPYFVCVMDRLRRTGQDYDYLLALHGDQLFIRDGIADYLDQLMTDSSYMAHGYLRSDEWCESRIPPLRRFNYGWKRIWRPLFGTERSSWSYSPGQVFRKEFVEKTAQFPNYDRIIKLAVKSRLLGIEELIYATLADAMGCNPLRFPEESGNHQPIVDLHRLKMYLDLPTVHMIHKIDMDPEDPVRQAVRELQNGHSAMLAELAPVEFSTWPLDPPWPSKGLTSRLKDLYFHFLP